MIPTETSLQTTIKEALQEKAPDLFKTLMQTGQLHPFLKMRAESAMETILQLHNDAMDESLRSGKTPMERVQMQTMLRNQAIETAIAQATDFQTISPNPKTTAKSTI